MPTESALPERVVAKTFEEYKAAFPSLDSLVMMEGTAEPFGWLLGAKWQQDGFYVTVDQIEVREFMPGAGVWILNPTFSLHREDTNEDQG